MLIDDEKDITEGVKLGLEQRGFEVDAFNDPLAAISGFRAGVYDLVICDIRMPEKSGFDVYRELKKKDARARICFFTAFEVYHPEFERVFPELEADCFIRKPVSTGELAKKIGEVIGGDGFARPPRSR
jgi:DNA-binding response OmpR family regulator